MFFYMYFNYVSVFRLYKPIRQIIYANTCINCTCNLPLVSFVCAEQDICIQNIKDMDITEILPAQYDIASCLNSEITKLYTE